MAKLLRHLGIGAKKAPPQPPKADYPSIKSTSSETALSKSPTSERSGSSHIGEFELAQLPGSPHRIAPSERQGSFGGARPKDSGGGGISPKSTPGDRASVSVDEPESTGSEKDSKSGAGGGQGASATPPRLLDEYSDPADLRKDNPEELLGACANPLVEDDYSVPYEVKSMFRDLIPKGLEGLPEAEALEKVKGLRLYDDPYEEPVVTGLPPGTRVFPPPFPPPETTDKRPKEDYDEPWEWSAKQSRLLQHQLEASGHNIIPPHFISAPSATQSVIPQLKRTTPGPASSSSPASSTRDGEEPGPDSGDGGAGSPTAAIAPTSTEVGAAEAMATASAAASGGGADDGQNGETEDVYEAASSYEQPPRTKEPDSDEDSYEHLRDEFKPGEPPEVEDDDDDDDDDPESGTARTGNYEEPWDLTSKQVELENKIKEASDRALRDQVAAAKTSGPAPHESDTRSQEGYEKPWDWKPHLKDDRPQEGYEKPWDWKPHQKDDRPPEEYEEPWDQKQKELDMLKQGSSSEALSPTSSAAAVGAAAPSSVKDNKEDDTRPPTEYDEPWDQKKKASLSRTGSSADGSPKSSPAAAAAALQQSLSPKKKSKLNLDLGSRGWNTLGERVDPNLPLNQQGWYHGSISRVDAENLLRVHKEGSYLVRMSESNKMDYSLSLKSTRGFMHMKIVSRDNRFILGQFSQPFDTIPQMIHHYSISKLPIKGAEHMSLLHPIMNELL